MRPEQAPHTSAIEPSGRRSPFAGPLRPRPRPRRQRPIGELWVQPRSRPSYAATSLLSQPSATGLERVQYRLKVVGQTLTDAGDDSDATNAAEDCDQAVLDHPL